MSNLGTMGDLPYKLPVQLASLPLEGKNSFARTYCQTCGVAEVDRARLELLFRIRNKALSEQPAYEVGTFNRETDYVLFPLGCTECKPGKIPIILVERAER